jgi:hypothetical protein
VIWWAAFAGFVVVVAALAVVGLGVVIASMANPPGEWAPGPIVGDVDDWLPSESSSWQ